MDKIIRKTIPNPEMINAKKMIFGTENIPKRIRKNKPMPYQVVTHDIVKDADVCIIGSGAAGAILANKILNGIEGFEGKNVVLIEKGGYYDPEDFNQRELSMMMLLWKNAGLQLNAEMSLLIAQGEVLGGSTMINDAVCFDTPDIVREQWRKDYGVNIDETKWINAISEVRERISVSRLSDEDIRKNKNALILKKACETHVPPYSGENNERNCINCATCGDCHLGCHYETKQDMVNTYIYEAIHSSNSNEFITYCNCDVRKINYEDGTAKGIEGKFLGNLGVETFSLKINAKVIILAAGAIASSKLLLSNNIKLDTAGKGLALHPATLLVGKFKDEIRASEGIPMAYSCTEFNVINWKNNGKTKGGFMLESIFTPIYQFSLQLPFDIHKNLMDDFQKYAMAGVMIRDESNGRITLSEKGNAKINYTLGDSEIKDLTDGIKELAGLFFDAGAEEVLTGHSTINQLTNRDQIQGLIDAIMTDHEKKKIDLKLGSAHPQGGNLMGSDPNTCVVDENCKVYGFRNLFVCDASVFPTAVGVNPQITVMSLATMTAEKILKVWNTSFENIQLKEHLGETCDISQPMFCNLQSLSIMFNQKENSGTLVDLLNTNNQAAQVGWLFDKKTLMITNPFHWRGFIPDIPAIDIPGIELDNWILKYLEGFWKKFYRDADGTIKGKLGVYVINEDDIEIVPEEKNYDIFGNVIQLTYPKVPLVYDLLKIIDENTILGKVFLTRIPSMYSGQPPFGIEFMPFSMTKKYPIEYIDTNDYNKIYDLSTPTTLDQISGNWSARIIMEHMLGPVFKVFHFKTNDDEPTKINLLSTMILKYLKKIHPPIQQTWSNEIKIVNENFMIGKLVLHLFEDNIDIPDEYIEETSENGTTQKRLVIRYTLSTFGGDKIDII